MKTKLEAIKERNELTRAIQGVLTSRAEEDRAFLLKLVEYARHTGYCETVHKALGSKRVDEARCNCGLTALLEQPE